VGIRSVLISGSRYDIGLDERESGNLNFKTFLQRTASSMQIYLSINLTTQLKNLESLRESVSECARAQGFDQKRISEIELSTEKV